MTLNEEKAERLKISYPHFFEGPIYHETLGEGTAVSLSVSYSGQAHLGVLFKKTNKVSIFQFPECSDLFSFSSPKPDSELTQKEQDLIFERKHYEKTVNYCIELSKKAENKERNIPSLVQMYDAWEDSSDFMNQITNDYEASQWLEKSNHPYFASIRSKKAGLVYIGTDEIPDEVEDWRSPNAALYYQFQMYLNDPLIGLELIRDHKTNGRRYIQFIDRFNINSNELTETGGLNIGGQSDKYLADIIKASRQENTHQIIRTIQKEQYEIISNMSEKRSLVVGCAGSGKTMVLFHKIAYLAFNEKNFDPENVLIISPNRLLKNEDDHLAKELKISDVKNYDSKEFFIMASEEISSLIGSHFPMRCKDYVETKEAYLFDVDLLTEIRNNSKNLFEKKDKSVIAAINGDLSSKLISLFKLKAPQTTIRRRIREITTETSLIGTFQKAIQKESESARKKYEEAYENLKRIPLSNLKYILKESEISPDANQYLRFLLQNFESDMKGRDRYSSKGELLKVVPEINYFAKLANKKTKTIKTSIYNPNMKGKAFFIGLHDYILLGKSLKDFAAYHCGGFASSLAFDYASYVIRRDLSSKYNFIDGELYDFECVLLLDIVTSLTGVCLKNRKHTFVDEFQNLSKIEIQLIEKLLPYSQISLFGDFKQAIAKRSIEPTDSLLISYAKHSLGFNYRNAKQICEYLNEQFSLNMFPIGIEGEIDFCDCSKESLKVIDGDGRVAVIVKEAESFAKKHPDILFNFVSAKEGRILQGSLNLLSVEDTKGLEFEKVFVLSEGMNENERYLACSRALNKLVLVF